MSTQQDRPALEPGPEHPITIEATPGRVLVRACDRLVASSDRALTLREASYPPVQYIPIEDVDQQLLRASDRHTYCPYKGDCDYYSVATPEAELVDVAWTYRHPYGWVGAIAGHVAFYATRAEVSIVG
jgi:uncharacterized protein (DUF427 family)